MRASDCTHRHPLMSASAIGRDSGGPWCSGCGKDMATLADAVAELVSAVRTESRIDIVCRWLGRRADRHPHVAAAIMVAFTVLVVGSILLSGGQPL